MVNKSLILENMNGEGLMRSTCPTPEEKIKLCSVNIKESNLFVRTRVQRRADEGRNLEEMIMFTIRELIFPSLDTIRKTGLKESQKTIIDRIESSLMDIISPFYYDTSVLYPDLTPTEIQVAQLIKKGKCSKEIAVVMNLSVKTIESHRKSIRKKIGIRNKKTNLRTYLLSIHESNRRSPFRSLQI